MSSDLERRVAKLERSSKRWRSAFVVAFVGLVGLGAAEAVKVPDEIVAKSFVVTDQSGETRMGMFSTVTTDSGRIDAKLTLTSSEDHVIVVEAGENIRVGQLEK